MNLAHHLRRMARAHPERPAVAVGTTIQFDYGALADRTARLARALLAKLGLSPGDRVAIASKNSVFYLECLYAIWHAGLIAVPINAKLHRSDFSFILENSGARACFASGDLANEIAGLNLADLAFTIEMGSPDYEALLEDALADPAPRDPTDPAWIFYTSGTTGRPKGAVLTNRNLLAMSYCYLSDVDPVPPWGAILHAAPMSHGSGLYALPYVLQGGLHVIPESAAFDPAEVFDLISRWDGTSFFAAPTMVKRLVDHTDDQDTANLKSIIYGGGPMLVEDCLAALDRFGPKLAQLYGQGESPMTITALDARAHAEKNHPRWKVRLGSVGLPQSAVEVRVAGANDETLPCGEVGEILVKGETVMSGYWQNQEASATTLRNGWLHTGDLGSFDEDGFLTLKDRNKDLIISGGTNIYPREVEEVLLMHDGVSEVAVVGRPDREWGEVVVAFIVPSPDTPATPAILEHFCLESMARFKRPKAYHFVDHLPKNNYGKILKTRLREIDAEKAG